ncbi:MAG: hypothetical protein AAB361_02620 [Patescibacteria group bacterium]
MAIVFISPRQRQKMFFLAITAIFTVIMIFILLTVFFINPKNAQPDIVFNKPKVSINLGALDSNDIKNLEPFPEMEIEFFYEALTAERKKIQGYIFASSEAEAAQKLKDLNLVVISIKEVEAGRENPFEPY